jgi:hypothetical protein
MYWERSCYKRVSWPECTVVKYKLGSLGNVITSAVYVALLINGPKQGYCVCVSYTLLQRCVELTTK